MFLWSNKAMTGKKITLPTLKRNKSNSTTRADLSVRRPPLPSFFLSVNTSGGEHKKGRVSELEGQQRASGRAMFLLSGPQWEGGKQGRSMRRRNGEAFFLMWLAREIMRAECFFGHRRLTSSAFLPLRRPIEWSRSCRVIHARKENRGGRGTEGRWMLRP